MFATSTPVTWCKEIFGKFRDTNNNNENITISSSSSSGSNVEIVCEDDSDLDSTWEETLTAEDSSSINTLSSTDIFDETISNSSGEDFSGFESTIHIQYIPDVSDYSEFCRDIPDASSTFIAKSRKNGLFSRKRKCHEKTFCDSPVPEFHKRRRSSRALYQENHDAVREVMNFCRDAKTLIQVLAYKLERLEEVCGSLLNRGRNNDSSMSGFYLLSDSIEL